MNPEHIVPVMLLLAITFIFSGLLGLNTGTSSSEKRFVKTECARYNPDTGDFEIIERKK